jgi:hypothetical protein
LSAIQKISLIIFLLPRRSVSYQKVLQVERNTKNKLDYLFIAEPQRILSKGTAS